LIMPFVILKLRAMRQFLKMFRSWLLFVVFCSRTLSRNAQDALKEIYPSFHGHS
jgi:hypothetical protein